jgi:Lon protease-like protein
LELSVSAYELPMFPLGTVLFPHARLPLHVFESRYRLMTRHVLDGSQEFGVVLIERGSEVGGGDTRFDVATVARVVQAAELPDGRFALSTVGTRRIQVEEWMPEDPYPRARVSPLFDPPPTAADIAARARAAEALAQVAALARQLNPEIPELPPLHDDPSLASFEAAALAPIGPLDAQHLLAAPDAGTRLTLLHALLEGRAEELRARLTFGG